jgi:amidohydrolase
MELLKLKEIAAAAIDDASASIIRLSRYINEHPECAYREFKAHKAITEFLAERGFLIQSGIGGLETAFLADYISSNGTPETAGTGFVPLAFIAEYDALPDIGHGCGHNMIAAAAAAAAVGTAAAIDSIASASDKAYAESSFRLIGSPAEEILTEAAGKNHLIQAGVFKNVGSALMFHPWGKTGVAVKDLGCKSYRIVFKGHTAHAAADPWNGRNALDAAVIFYNSLGLLRQQLPTGFFIHCIIIEGGTVLNVIPDKAVVEVMLRSTELEDLHTVVSRLEDCVNAAAAAAGCEVEMKSMSSVKPIRFNRGLFDLAAANMRAAGEELEEFPLWQASSDFGDVSHEVPALSILYKTHDEHTGWHSKEVADESVSKAANEALLRVSKILAATAIDIISRKS